MALSVIEEKDANDTTMVVVIESDKEDGGLAYTELRGPDCRRLAIMHAAKQGLSQPGINNMPITYPVDKKGNEIVTTGTPHYRFRADVSVTRKIV